MIEVRSTIHSLRYLSIWFVAFLSVSLGASSDLNQLLNQVDGDRMAARIAELASDAYQGRFPGTVGEERTTAYLTDQMERIGLEAPYSGSYLQQVPLLGAQARELAAMKVHTAQDTLILQPFADYYALAPGLNGQVELKEVKLAFVGFGIVAEEYQWDDYASLDVTGKIVIMRRNEPDIPGAFQDKALSPHALTEGKWEQAAKRGALGVMMVHEDAIAGYDWNVLAKGAGAIKYRLPAADEKTQMGHRLGIEESAVARIFEAAGASWEQALAASSQRGFKAMALPASISTTFTMEQTVIQSHNVIGVLRGAGQVNEAVVFTAHWDHVGMSNEQKEDYIFNGAIDNATGTAALLEIATLFAQLKPPPQRSVIFIATTAEEQGLLGAHYYADHPLIPLSETAGVFNLDALFPFGAFNGMTVVGLGSSELENYLIAAAPLVNRSVHADSSPEFGAFFRSDHYPFAQRGVPAVFAVGGPDPKGHIDDQLMQRFMDYGANGYHKPADEYDAATWDMAGIVQDVKMFLHAGIHLANDQRFPNWFWDSPFRAVRDTMR